MCKQEVSGSCAGCALIEAGASVGVHDLHAPKIMADKIHDACPPGRRPHVREIKWAMQRMQRERNPRQTLQTPAF
jgi:hypothetical protein